VSAQHGGHPRDPASRPAPRDARGAAYVGLVALAKLAASSAVLLRGFRAVSDDDFARVVIAEQWAHAPRWDASGTSWLPFPFWLHGAAMLAFGRSLATARVAAAVLGVGAALLVYLAARWLGEDRRAAAAGAVVAAVFPWSAWLGVATVPELPTAALILLAAASLAGDAPRRRLLGGAALFAATLSRYEAWPVAALFAALCLVEAARKKRPLALVPAALALLGPASWLAWNRLAHGDALHFLARVAAYKQALGGAEPGAATRLWAYPLSMVREEPELAALFAASAALLALRRGSVALRSALAPYARPAAILGAQIAALSLAMIKDGAPTHHPERAVLAALLLLAVCAGALAARVGAWWLSLPVFAAALASALVRPLVPRERFADREAQAAIGRAAASLARPGEKVLLEVEDYGYLAIIAGFGRPEDALPERSIDPRLPPAPDRFADPRALPALLATTEARWAVARRREDQVALGPPLIIHGPLGIYPLGAFPR
jgi:hypothetical protein